MELPPPVVTPYPLAIRVWICLIGLITGPVAWTLIATIARGLLP